MERDQNHILGAFSDALNRLRDDVLIMGSFSIRGLNNAFKGLLKRDADLCNLAIADDEEIDELEKRLDKEGVDILLRFHPVASDLREVISAMKISGNLERVGDQAVTIARRARKLNRESQIEISNELQPLFNDAMQMLEDALRCYSERDIELANELIRRDRFLDDKCNNFDGNVSKQIAEDAKNARSYLNLLFISRSLERVGDHASNIAEDVIYLANANDVRHSQSAVS